MKAKYVILGFLVLASAVVFLLIDYRTRAEQAPVWHALSDAVPARPLTPAEALLNSGPISSRQTHDGTQVGSIRLANGDVWRFAFRSHHLLDRLSDLDSFSVFAGPSGTYRVRGPCFCCEVQLPADAVAKGSPEFLAFLQRSHPFVEHVP